MISKGAKKLYFPEKEISYRKYFSSFSLMFSRHIWIRIFVFFISWSISALWAIEAYAWTESEAVSAVKTALDTRFSELLSKSREQWWPWLQGDTLKSIMNGAQYVYTSEIVPGAFCECISGNGGGNINTACTGPVEQRKYACLVQWGMSGFQSMFVSITRWITYLVFILGVLAIVGLGIAWSVAWGDDVKMKTTIKTWAINIAVGIILLFAFPYILKFLAPWIFQ